MKLTIANRNYSSWSLRPWVLMRALDIAFEEKLVPFGHAEDPRGFHAFSPTGLVPCLLDDDTVVWESLAIVEYLAERQAGVWPQEPRARAWARCAAAEMHAGFATLRTICTMNCGVRVELGTKPAALAKDWARIDALWSEGLARFGGPFLAGEQFSAVDAFFAPVVFRAQTYGTTLSPSSQAWVQRMLALPAMREWYEAALTEPWRDEAHEAELAMVGRVVADFRAPRV